MLKIRHVNWMDVKMKNQEIVQICREIKKLRSELTIFEDQHLCKEVSLAIAVKLASRGVICRYVAGEFLVNGEVISDHYWIVVDGIIYDATADQFECTDDILVCKENDAHYREDHFFVVNSDSAKLIARAISN